LENSYSSQGVKTWRVQVARKIDDHEYPWNSLVPLSWKLLDLPGTRVPAPSGNQLESVAGWWMPALHILAFGLGWTDLGKGLQHWREDGYRTDNPVLSFIYNTYGPSIQALEIWLMHLAGAQLTENLKNLRTAETYRPSPRDFTFIEDADQRIRKFCGLSEIGPRHSLGAKLISGGTDPLHLTLHFPEFEPLMREPDYQDEETDGGFERPYVLRVASYNEWPSALAKSTGTYGRRTAVFVDGIGYLGIFAFDYDSKRWYRWFSDEDGGQTMRYWHQFGN
jgi:hypothetical protein